MAGDNTLRCDGCDAEIYAVRQGEATLRTPMVKLLEDGSVAVKCPGKGCTRSVPVPFLSHTPPPPEPRRRGRRVIVRRDFRPVEG